MSNIKNECPTKSREAMLYRSALAAAAKKAGLNAVKFEEKGIPYEDVYKESSQQLARENAARFRAKMTDPYDLRQWGAQMTPELGREAFGMEVTECTED